MTEAKFQIKFGQWVLAYWNKEVSARFELKLVDLKKKSTLNFKSCIPKHQIRALSADRHYFKIPDAGYQNPYDCYHIAGHGYLVVQFWRPRVDHFYMIDIHEILALIEEDEKSLNEETSNRIGIKCYFS